METTTATIIAAPVVPVPAPPAAVAPAPAKANGAGKPKVKTISIPQNAFIARVRREAAAEVQKRLGISLDDAEKIVKSAGDKTNGPPKVNVQASVEQAVKAAMGEADKHRKAADVLRRQLDEAKRNHAKANQRLKDKVGETELRFEAVSLGVRDPDYALHLFSRAVMRGETTDPKAFFAGLRTTHDHLFKEPVVVAPVVPVKVLPSTAPAESRAQGEVKPDPAQAGTPAKTTNVDDMKDAEFSQHARSKYGYTQGMG